jgi:hypothetical protein
VSFLSQLCGVMRIFGGCGWLAANSEPDERAGTLYTKALESCDRWFYCKTPETRRVSNYPVSWCVIPISYLVRYFDALYDYLKAISSLARFRGELVRSAFRSIGANNFNI